MGKKREFVLRYIAYTFCNTLLCSSDNSDEKTTSAIKPSENTISPIEPEEKTASPIKPDEKESSAEKHDENNKMSIIASPLYTSLIG